MTKAGALRPEVYSRGMATMARNAARMYVAEASGPPPHTYSTLEDVFTVQATVRTATTMKKTFLSWYAKVSGLLLSGLMLESELRKNPQLFVAGQLSDFANTVDCILAVADTLWDAGQLVRTHGWLQHETGNPQRGFSLQAAMSLALWNLGRKDKWVLDHQEGLWRDVLGTVREYLRTSFLTEWNDAPGRTADEVIWLLEWCATDIRIIKE